MTTPTFAPSVNPSFVVPVRHTPVIDATTAAKGYRLVRVKTVRHGHVISLTWKALSKDQLDEILSFFDALNGSIGPFYWTPLDTLRSPTGLTPELSLIDGGSIGALTWHVQWTWGNSTESQESLPTKQGTIVAAANKLLVVSLPVFPVGVDGAWIYLGASSTVYKQYSYYATTRTWTISAYPIEPGAVPPTTSTLKPPLLWTLASDFEETKLAAGVYSLSVQFERQNAA